MGKGFYTKQSSSTRLYSSLPWISDIEDSANISADILSRVEEIKCPIQSPHAENSEYVTDINRYSTCFKFTPPSYLVTDVSFLQNLKKRSLL